MEMKNVEPDAQAVLREAATTDVFVEEAGDEGEGRSEVEHREDEHAPHEPLQLVGLGAVGLHDGADLDEGGEADDEEHHAGGEARGQRHDDEPQEGRVVPQAHEAGAGEYVALDLLHDEDDDGQDGGHGPRHGVEPLRFGVDRLLKVE